MLIYLDKNYKCHTVDDGTMRSYETGLFDGMCTEFIEGCRFVPEGETWVREDGVEFTGEMCSPWKDYAELDAAQREYERQEREDMRNALNELGVYVNG